MVVLVVLAAGVQRGHRVLRAMSVSTVRADPPAEPGELAASAVPAVLYSVTAAQEAQEGSEAPVVLAAPAG